MNARHAHLKDRALYHAFYEADQRFGRVDMPLADEPRLVWALAAVGPTDDVIDIGCHKGELTFSVRAKTTGRVVGLDISRNALYHAVAFAQKQGIDVEWHAAEAERLPFPANSFDVALLCEILEHVVDPTVVLAEAERVVRESGTIVVSTPGNALWFDAYEAPERLEKTGFALDMHVREYDPAVELAGKPDLACEVATVAVPEDARARGVPDFIIHLARYRVEKGPSRAGLG